MYVGFVALVMWDMFSKKAILSFPKFPQQIYLAARPDVRCGIVGLRKKRLTEEKSGEKRCASLSAQIPGGHLSQ